MSTYFVDFVAYVDIHKKPDGFPTEVHLQDIFDNVQSTEHLQTLVNDRFVNLIAMPGLVVLKDPDEALQSGTITFNKRRFVPWHLLTHMEVSVSQIAPKPSVRDLVPTVPIPESKQKEAVN